MTSSPETLGLRECAERLGVHYMTAYRYVRLGMLPAAKVGAEWRVAATDLEEFRASGAESGARHDAPWADRLQARMIAGDAVGAWKVVEGALAAGHDSGSIYLEVIAPALRAVGEGWESGALSIGDEHRASAVAGRILGRMSSRFIWRGRRRGRVLVGTPPGERHALPATMVADMLRGAGFEVIDLGSDLPVADFAAAVSAALPVVAVGVSVTSPEALESVPDLLAAIREAGAGGAIVVGGGAVRDARHARDLGADGYAGDGRGAVEFALGRLRG